MKISQALETIKALDMLAGRPVPIKFSYAAAVNRRRLVEFQHVYERNRLDLLKQFAKKDENGEIVTHKFKFTNGAGEEEERDSKEAVIEDKEGFEAAFKALGEADVPVTLHKVALADCPSEMAVEIMEALLAGGMLAEEVAA